LLCELARHECWFVQRLVTFKVDSLWRTSYWHSIKHTDSWCFILQGPEGLHLTGLKSTSCVHVTVIHQLPSHVIISHGFYVVFFFRNKYFYKICTLFKDHFDPTSLTSRKKDHHSYIVHRWTARFSTSNVTAMKVVRFEVFTVMKIQVVASCNVLVQAASVFTLKMEAASPSETSVSCHIITLSHIMYEHQTPSISTSYKDSWSVRTSRLQALALGTAYGMYIFRKQLSLGLANPPTSLILMYSECIHGHVWALVTPLKATCINESHFPNIKMPLTCHEVAKPTQSVTWMWTGF
jgi:hypothetical protein